MGDTEAVRTEHDDGIVTVTLSRPDVRNAVDGPTASALAAAFRAFEDDEEARVAVFHGANGTFCAGADLKSVAAGLESGRANPAVPARFGFEFDRLSGDAPMGPSRMVLSKPVIAAVSGHAVAGGMELALWCDLRVMEEDAVFGVYCRRWGVPLIDGGTVRLPRIVGHGRALDLILTGRPVGAEEALAMGLANRVVKKGEALKEAQRLAREIAAFPQGCMRSDRMSAYEQWDLGYAEAMANEYGRGRAVIASGETREGASRFAAGKGRGGRFDDI